MMSLIAISLSVGLLVDDAIVEIENIVRHMRMGKSAYQAAIDAADEIGLAVVATTFSIVAVFLPVGVMGGVSGQFFKNFGLTVVASVLMSLAVARTITPMIAAYFMKEHGIAEHAGGKTMDRYLQVLEWSLDKSASLRERAKLNLQKPLWWYWPLEILLWVLILAAAISGAMAVSNYAGMLSSSALVAYILALLAACATGALAIVALSAIGRIALPGFSRFHSSVGGRIKARRLDHRIWMMGVGLGALLISVAMIAATPVQFFPPTDTDFVRVQVEMVPGTTLRQTEAVADRVEDILQEQQETALVLEIVNESKATLFITLRDDRDRKSTEYSAEVGKLLNSIPDARVFFETNEGPGGGTGRDITVMLLGNDSVLLERTARDLVEEMSGLSQVVAPRISADLQQPELIIEPRDDIAASLGVTTQQLGQVIRIATLGEIDQNAAKFSLSDRQIPIRVILSREDRSQIDVIRNLPVPTSSGGSVPLERVANIRFGAGPTTIERQNQQSRVFVGADLAPGVDKGTAMAAINKLPTLDNLPAGVTTEPFGVDRWQAETVTEFGTALVSGILLVFGVLVLLYKRVMSPLVNMGSLLLAPLGGLIAIKLIGQPISLPVFIGILMLFGIVAKNSILLIDFALEEMASGVAKFDAIMEAGRKRAQPIVMTTIAMTAGMVPTALSIGGDGAWRAPMGSVVIGGLILSTFLTLLIVPAGFSLADGLERRLGPWLRRNLLTYRTPEDIAIEEREAKARDAGRGGLPDPAE
mgnify:CR=1 FL=1